MRYHIDTIPVWDALRAHTECPLCLLRRKTEHQLADRYLGASVMEPDTRIRVNAKGFCQDHHQMLYDLQNRLGHALMMLSHIQELRKKVEPALQGATPSGAGMLQKMFGKPAAAPAQDSALTPYTQGCVLCDTLQDSMDAYAFTLLHLWKTDSTFQKEFAASKGLCLPDAAWVLHMAPQHLSGQALSSLDSTVKSLLRDNLKRLEEELDWFTRKFDYRNADKPWGESRDALERAAQKLRGWCVGKDPGLDA